MFNIIMSKGGIYGNVLDLFSGSGALGIEALSRGAETAVFVDADPASVKLTRKNLDYVGVQAEVYNADYRVALKKLNAREFDFIFIDPPYADRNEQNIVSLICEYGILSRNGMLIIEHSKSNDLHISEDCFIIDKRVCGNTCLTFAIPKVEED